LTIFLKTDGRMKIKLFYLLLIIFACLHFSKKVQTEKSPIEQNSPSETEFKKVLQK